eukprot:6206394-Pleurochrysis_carterae.AAC.1
MQEHNLASFEVEKPTRDVRNTRLRSSLVHFAGSGVGVGGEGEHYSGEPHPQEGLLVFCSELRETMQLEREFASLVAVFSKGIDDETSDAAALRNLINQLCDAEGESADRELDVADRELDVASMRVLVAMLKEVEAETERGKHVLQRRQKRLVELGAHKVCLAMTACRDDEFYQLGLQLGIALLHGGNRFVQDALYDELSRPRKVLGFDGSDLGWLGAIKLRLRLGSKEIVERKLFNETHEERVAQVDGEATAVSASADWMLREEASRGFETSAFVVDTLEILRLLCEARGTRTAA